MVDKVSLNKIRSGYNLIQCFLGKLSPRILYGKCSEDLTCVVAVVIIVMTTMVTVFIEHLVCIILFNPQDKLRDTVKVHFPQKQAQA